MGHSSSSFGCGAGDHKFPLATTVMGQGLQLTMIQHTVQEYQKALGVFQE